MTRTDPNHSEGPTRLQPASFFHREWPIAVAVMLAWALILALYSTLRIESNAGDGSARDLLRAHLLVVAVILGSVITFAIVSWRVNRLCREELDRANAELLKYAAS